MEDIEAARTQQDRLSQLTADLLRQIQEVGGLRPEDRDRLPQLELDQRELGQRLATDEQRSLAARAEAISQEFPRNQLTDPATEGQLQQLLTALDQLRDSGLLQGSTALTEAGKILGSMKAEDPAAEREAVPALERAQRAQEEVATTLDELQRQLAGWRSEQARQQQLATLLDEQQQINKAAAEAGAATVGRTAAELTRQQRADLQQLAQRQRQQARHIDQFEQQLRQQSAASEDSAPQTAAETLDAADRLKDAQLGAKLQQAADDLAANRFGQAGEKQQQAEEVLKQLREEWDARQPDDLDQLVKKVDTARAQAEALAEQEELLRKKTEEALADGLSEPERAELQQQAATLRKEIQRMERQLEKLRLKPAAEAARRAGERLRNAQKQLEQGGDAGAAQTQMEQAGDDIQQLQQELADVQQNVAEQLAQEETEKLAAQLKAIKTREEGLLAEFIRLEGEKTTRGQFTRGQLRSLKDLAEVQKQLAEEVQNVAGRMGDVAVLQTALEQVARDQRRVAARLDARLTDLATQQATKQVIARLGRIDSVWNDQAPPQAPPEKPPGEAPPPEEQQPKNAAPPGESLPPMLELKLLRALQADCLERTKAWDEYRQTVEKLTDDELAQLAALAVEQGELSNLADRLIEEMKPPAATEDLKPDATQESTPAPDKGPAKKSIGRTIKDILKGTIKGDAPPEAAPEKQP